MSGRRVSFSPDTEGRNEGPIMHPTPSSRDGRRRVVGGGVFRFHVRSSPTARRLLSRIGAGVAKTLSFMSLKSSSSSHTKSTLSTCSSSSLSCSSSSSVYLVKSKSVNELEFHRAEAIEDCIEFLHSSSSLDRASSISAWSC